MHAELVRTFHFEAAHHLQAAPQGHKCRQLHGHSYRVDVHVAGEVDADRGWVMDFSQISAAVAPVIDTLDHALLNDVPGLETPTTEMLAKYIWDRIAPTLPLSAVTVWESTVSRCVYRGA
ncbi:MAG: 6-carboxytetrahydropterin synthase QueD [Phycisphaerae bacterium]|nr:6-carboxytetrahydropterin synthase QueD [Phycisphaerae bacterium]